MSSGDFRYEKKRSSPDAPSKALAHYTMGIIYDNEGRSGEAMREYKAALALEPKVSYLHSRLGVDFFLAKDIDKAVEEFNIANPSIPTTQSRDFCLRSRTRR
ncbi:MAG: tetratricopeptide repeat protein [Candidatus Omnitrophica bacterium]|nr:tetratricopeptide repeat protein [Candidatus Omnitrophota bacterium]